MQINVSLAINLQFLVAAARERGGNQQSTAILIINKKLVQIVTTSTFSSQKCSTSSNVYNCFTTYIKSGSTYQSMMKKQERARVIDKFFVYSCNGSFIILCAITEIIHYNDIFDKLGISGK